jgi:membrane-associated phospholipid phosphatase
VLNDIKILLKEFMGRIIRTYQIKFIILTFGGICLVEPIFSQPFANDSSFHPYEVNYWVTGSICGVGLVTNLMGISHTLNKEDISLVEIQSLNRESINGIDYLSLKQDPSKADTYLHYSDYVLTFSVALPVFLLFDKRISKDWYNILLMYMETLTITTNFYEWSFLGPTFQNRFRPITYYNQLTYDQKKSGYNRNSFYSGHTATAAVSTFFMAKVYCDYNPDIGNNKYFLYSAAAIPPFMVGYFRVKAMRHFPSDVMVGLGVGALFGIIIPEFHSSQDKNISLGPYSSFEATGIAIKWQPGFLK